MFSRVYHLETTKKTAMDTWYNSIYNGYSPWEICCTRIIKKFLGGIIPSLSLRDNIKSS